MFVGSDQIVGFESQACHKDEGSVSIPGLQVSFSSGAIGFPLSGFGGVG